MARDSKGVVYELFRLEMTDSSASLHSGWATRHDTPRHVRREELLFCRTKPDPCVVVPETRFRLFAGIGDKAPDSAGGLVTRCVTQPWRLRKADVSLKDRMPVSEVYQAGGRVGQVALVAVIEFTKSSHEASEAASITGKIGEIEEFGRGQVEQTLEDGRVAFGGYTVLALGRNSIVQFGGDAADMLSYKPSEAGSSLVLV